MKKLISLALALVLCFAVSAGVAQESAADEMFGTINGSRYENPMMGLGCVLDGWSYSSQEEILAQYNKTRDAGSDKLKEIFESNTSVIVLFAESADRKTNVNMVMDSAALAYITAAGYDTYVEQMKEEYGRLAPDQGWEDFSCEIIQRQFAGETVSGLKSSFTYSGIKIFQTQVYYLNGDYVDICTVTSYLTDNGDSVLEQFYRMIN